MAETAERRIPSLFSVWGKETYGFPLDPARPAAPSEALREGG